MPSDDSVKPAAKIDKSLLDSVTRRQTLKGALALSALLAPTATAHDGKAEDEKLSALLDANKFSQDGDQGARRFVKFFENNTMVSGVLDIPAGEKESQTPHIVDEFYIVLKGRGKLTVDGQQYAAYPGAVLFVKAGVEHHFLDVEEDLQVVVIFSMADPEGVPFFAKK